MKKKLLFTAYNLDIGGIEKALVNLLNKINYNKYEVTLILEKKEGRLLNQINKNVSIKELKVSNNKFILFRKALNYLRKLKFRLFNKNKYDFSCCYATYSYSGNLLARIASKNSMIYVHSNYVTIFNNDEKKLKEFFDTRSIDKFKYITFVSNESKNDFLKYYKNYSDKSLVYNNFIDIENVLKLSKDDIEIERPKDKIVLLFVGRLEDESKKLERAFKIVREFDNTILWIVGDGPDRKKYEDIVNKYNINNRVVFFGMKSNPYPYMRLTDYLILTSDYEGFPVTYLEAFVLNKKIITTIPVSDDKLDFSKIAYIISKDKNMISEVKSILKDNKEYKKISLRDIQEERMKSLEKIFDDKEQ